MSDQRSRARLIFRSDRVRAALRRAFDIAGALIGIVIFAPIVAVAAVAILLEDGGPIFFTQKRVGRYERLFSIYKLRTMRKEKCFDALSPRTSNDDRITRVGRILRKYSIDEFPQLINVVRGEMSIVGPRPEMPFIVRRYERWQHLRHLVRPGITCIWQARYRSTIPLEKPEATHLDLEYIRQASPLTDSMLIVQTITAVFSARGSY